MALLYYMDAALSCGNVLSKYSPNLSVKPATPRSSLTNKPHRALLDKLANINQCWKQKNLDFIQRERTNEQKTWHLDAVVLWQSSGNEKMQQVNKDLARVIDPG
jgi:hypothetical protein